MGRNLAILALLIVASIVVFGLALWILIRLLPFLLAVIFALLVGFFLLMGLLMIVGLITTGIGAIYYAIKKRPRTEGLPVTLRDVKEPGEGVREREREREDA